MSDELAELLAIFRAEVSEDLERFGAFLDRPVENWPVEELLRVTHKVKGSTRVVDATSMYEVTHAIEELLLPARGGHRLQESVATLVREGLLLLEACYDAIEGGEPEVATFVERATHVTKAPQDDASEAAPSLAESSVAARVLDTLRVHVGSLDELWGAGAEVTLMMSAMKEELVRLAQRVDKDRALTSATQQLIELTRQTEHVCQRFEHKLRSVRMVPLANIGSVLMRVVRDAGQKTGKEVELHFDSGRTEIDRTMIEGIRDALTHLIRNAVAHGIESPEQRKAAGKPTTGKIQVTVVARGEALELSVIDDGAGIDTGRVLARAQSLGLVDRAIASSLTENERLELIFAPGFSSGEVADLAGRGVGLEVVRQQARAAGGDVRCETKLGVGTTFRFPVKRVRLTTRVLAFRLGDSWFVVPVSTVVRTTRDGAPTRLVDGSLIMELGGKLVPVRPLEPNFGRGPSRRPHRPGVMLTGSGGEAVVLVDEIQGDQEAIVYPLPWNLRGMRHVTGCVSLGHERFAMVLDADSLVTQALETRFAGASDSSAVKERRRNKVLVVDDSATSRTLITMILRQAGYDVAVAQSGAEAWDRLQAGDIEILVSDVEMPELDGLALVRRIRDNAKLQDLPVLLVTSLGTELEKRAGADAGADAYFVKNDFEQGALLDTVARLAQ